MSWQPTETDLNWTKNVLFLIKDGGALIWPYNGNVYRVSRTNQTVSLDSGEMDETHFRFMVCLGRIGYSYIVPKGVEE